MNAITAIPANTIPVSSPPAELAQKLATFDGMDLVRGTVPAIVVQQARQYLAVLERYHAPANPARIEMWCYKLRGGTAPISDRDFAQRLEAITEDCGDLPAWVWNRETLRLVRRANEFFPTSKAVYDALSAISNRATLGISQVRMLAGATPASAQAAATMARPEQIERMRREFGAAR